VLGANVGSGVLAILATSGASPQVRRLRWALPLQGGGRADCRAAAVRCHVLLQQYLSTVHEQVVAFPLRLQRCHRCAVHHLDRMVARICGALAAGAAVGTGHRAPAAPGPSALATPSLAISCAAREALHQADVVETMLRGIRP